MARCGFAQRMYILTFTPTVKTALDAYARCPKNSQILKLEKAKREDLTGSVKAT